MNARKMEDDSPRLVPFAAPRLPSVNPGETFPSKHDRLVPVAGRKAGIERAIASNCVQIRCQDAKFEI